MSEKEFAPMFQAGEKNWVRKFVQNAVNIWERLKEKESAMDYALAVAKKSLKELNHM